MYYIVAAVLFLLYILFVFSALIDSIFQPNIAFLLCVAQSILPPGFGSFFLPGSNGLI